MLDTTQVERFMEKFRSSFTGLEWTWTDDNNRSGLGSPLFDISPVKALGLSIGLFIVAAIASALDAPVEADV